eukprot:g1360.t1
MLSLLSFLVLGTSIAVTSGNQEWAPLPAGHFHVSCIHHHDDNNFIVEVTEDGFDKVTYANGTTTLLPPCPYNRVVYGSSMIESLHQGNAEDLSYYSGWVAYTKSLAASAYTSMSSTWQVPPKPKKSGPAGLSAVYLFNGLEDGGGISGAASFIMQPVLSYGRSGCILNPLEWHQYNLVSYLVSGSGRAHCGKRIKVNPGDIVVGEMTNNGNNHWDVKGTLIGGAKNLTSVYEAILDSEVKVNAAYVTLEAMVIYSCDAYPTDHVTFTNNQLVPNDMHWQKLVNHSECNQTIAISENTGDIDISFR